MQLPRQANGSQDPFDGADLAVRDAASVELGESLRVAHVRVAVRAAGLQNLTLWGDDVG